MSVTRDGLVPLGCLDGLLGAAVHPSTLNSRVNTQTYSLSSRSQQLRVEPGWLPSHQSRCRLWAMPKVTASS
jgi:hypothetical protein